MEDTSLDLSNRGLSSLDSLIDMISQYAPEIQMINLSGNYLKYIK